MTQEINILIIEDNEDDEELILRELARGGFLVEHTRVATSAGLLHALGRKKWDVILCDYVMPGFGAPAALKLAKEQLLDEVPFIIVSGAIGEETAVEIMRSGADDFISKGNLKRLVPVIKRELADAKSRAEKKKAEQENLRLRSAIEQSGEAVVMTDAESHIVYVNAAFEKITGYSRAEALGKNPRILKSGKQDSEFYKKMWGVLASGRTWFGRLINRRKDGTLFEEISSISPVLDASGKITNYVAVKRDVTEQEMLFRAKDHFTRVTSHEMNTPLSKLTLAMALLKEPGSTDATKIEKARSVLEDAYANFERICSATSLLSDLELHEIMTTLPLLLKPIISVAVETAREMTSTAGRNVNIKEILDIPLNAQIMCEQRMIIQMLQEIISNAVKYTPDGKDVTVSARQDGEFAVVEVSDNGPGIPAELREAVFHPFFSLENTLQHQTGEYSFKGGGIGLGLTLAKMIANFHKGSIDLLSNEHGSTVTIRLPIDKK
jgi:PAS domain S-box-containing protein